MQNTDFARVRCGCLALGWLMLIGCYGGPRSSADSIADAAAAPEAWAAAYNSHDPGQVLSRYAPDAVFWGTTSATLRDSPAAIEEYFSGLVNRPDARVTIGASRARVFGEFAIVSGEYAFDDVVDGTPVTRPSRFSFVYRLAGAEWLIIDHHSSRMPAT